MIACRLDVSMNYRDLVVATPKALGARAHPQISRAHPQISISRPLLPAARLRPAGRAPIWRHTANAKSFFSGSCSGSCLSFIKRKEFFFFKTQQLPEQLPVSKTLAKPPQAGPRIPEEQSKREQPSSKLTRHRRPFNVDMLLRPCDATQDRDFIFSSSTLEGAF